MSTAFNTQFEPLSIGVSTARPLTTVVVADGLALVREGLAKLCADIPGCRVVAQCGDGMAAFRAISHCQPSIALLDLHLAEVHTVDLVRRLKVASPGTKTVVISTRRDRKSAFEAIRAGAAGFVLKSGPLEDLTEAIEQINAGGVYVSPLVELEKRPDHLRQEPDAFETLSSREHQVFSMLVDGVRAKEIAARLDLSPKTVDTYRSSLMRKLDIHDVAGLVKFAIARELTSPRQ